MNTANHQHPFAASRHGDHQYYYVTATDRIDAVKRMTDTAQLRACLEVTDLQKTVERAVLAKLKKMEKTS